MSHPRAAAEWMLAQRRGGAFPHQIWDAAKVRYIDVPRRDLRAAYFDAEHRFEMENSLGEDTVRIPKMLLEALLAEILEDPR